MANSFDSPHGCNNVVARVQQLDSNYVFVNNPEIGISEASIIPNNHGGDHKFEVQMYPIENTALIDPSIVGNENHLVVNLREIKLEKRPRRRARKAGKRKERFDRRKGKGGPILMYSRKEMEDLRFHCSEDQLKKWTDVYCGFDASVKQEYDCLLDSPNIHQNNSSSSFNVHPTSPQIQKSANLYAVAALVRENYMGIVAH